MHKRLKLRGLSCKQLFHAIIPFADFLISWFAVACLNLAPLLCYKLQYLTSLYSISTGLNLAAN